MSLITIRDLQFAYPDGRRALAGVDFTLDDGETVVLLGASGSGKTTFLLHLNGLLRGTGEITICGQALEDKALETIRARVGLLFQDANDQLFLPTVLEDVAFGLLNRGVPADKAAAEARAMLERLHIADLAARAPHHLSEGEKRRVALAGVLVMEPSILLLDEPTTSLDPPTRRDLLALLAGLPQAKVIVTHDPAFARAIGTRAVFFESGRIIDSGPVGEVLARRNWE